MKKKKKKEKTIIILKVSGLKALHIITISNRIEYGEF